MRRNENGNSLIAALVVSAAMIAGAVTFSQWSRATTSSNSRQAAVRSAFNYADSGISGAISILRLADAGGLLPGGTTTFHNPSPLPSGRFEVAAHRSPTDATLVDLVSTGYYYLPRGSAVDPSNGQGAQMSVIRSRVRLVSVG